MGFKSCSICCAVEFESDLYYRPEVGYSSLYGFKYLKRDKRKPKVCKACREQLDELARLKSDKFTNETQFTVRYVDEHQAVKPIEWPIPIAASILANFYGCFLSQVDDRLNANT